jgi:hypothetical protein
MNTLELIFIIYFVLYIFDNQDHDYKCLTQIGFPPLPSLRSAYRSNICTRIFFYFFLFFLLSTI